MVCTHGGSRTGAKAACSPFSKLPPARSRGFCQSQKKQHTLTWLVQETAYNAQRVSAKGNARWSPSEDRVPVRRWFVAMRKAENGMASTTRVRLPAESAARKAAASRSGRTIHGSMSKPLPFGLCFMMVCVAWGRLDFSILVTRMGEPQNG